MLGSSPCDPGHVGMVPNCSREGLDWTLDSISSLSGGLIPQRKVADPPNHPMYKRHLDNDLHNKL